MLTAQRAIDKSPSLRGRTIAGDEAALEIEYLDETGARCVAESAHEWQKQQDSFATLVTHMDRVSTRGSLRRMSLFPGLEQVATNISANILLLEER